MEQKRENWNSVVWAAVVLAIGLLTICASHEVYSNRLKLRARKVTIEHQDAKGRKTSKTFYRLTDAEKEARQ